MRQILGKNHARPAPAATAPTGGFEYALELCAAEGLTGWVAHPVGGRSVRVRRGESVVAEAPVTIARPDIGRLFPDWPRSREAGFSLRLPGTWDRPERVTVELVATDGDFCPVERTIWPSWPASQPAAPSDFPATGSPLPLDVAGALAELRPHAYGTPPWTEEVVRRAVDDTVEILRNRAQVKPVLRWAHYLRTMHACFEFVSGHFQRFNTGAEADAKDAAAIGTSADEMLAIANHLYVLRSAGAEGALLECGCYKGFSTCCLSHACAWLGVPMHTFDSFAGLPGSESDYYNAGEFCGSMREVSGNLATFGRPAVVDLHEGFFADTLPSWRGPVLGIFMDVDLESSAADVMQLLPLLDRQSAVFSHEIPPDTFTRGVPRRDASEVVPPIVDAFAGRGDEVCGGHAGGLLGAFWAAGAGVPVLGPAELTDVVAAARQP